MDTDFSPTDVFQSRQPLQASQPISYESKSTNRPRKPMTRTTKITIGVVVCVVVVAVVFIVVYFTVIRKHNQNLGPNKFGNIL